MNNSEKVNPRVKGFILLTLGLLTSLGGLPFMITGSLIDNSTQIFWQIAGLIIGTLLVLGVAISFITFGISFMYEDSYPDKEYFRVYIALLTLLTLAIGFLCHYFLTWITSNKEQSFIVKIFWTTSVITYIFCLLYSHKKIQNRISEVLEQTKILDKYLGDLFNEINSNKLTYGAAFLKIKKEIPQEHFRIQCTNKIIFKYQKLTKDEKEYDYKSFLNDKSTLSDFYPLKSHRNS